ncbi:MAG: sigma-70 family RNA polymerase sigma factor [Phycisphaerae bacterium]|jgi:RNA polymerase sigma-70 factor (ECF subfamily)|nr:sigma-70 family RNA polymerase sigma factor [Phycisphaerae bacterium]
MDDMSASDFTSERPAASRSSDFETVYRELRQLVRAQKARDRCGEPLQVTSVVRETWQRLTAADPKRWGSAKTFASLAAEAMRRLLIDHARERAAKAPAGGSDDRVRSALAIDDPLDFTIVSEPEAIVRFDGVLQRLAAIEERAAEIVRLRSFAGLTIDEVAEAFGEPASRVKRDWQFARNWLVRELDRT